MTSPDPRIAEAIKILVLARDHVEFVIGQTSINEPLIEAVALISSVIKLLAD